MQEWVAAAPVPLLPPARVPEGRWEQRACRRRVAQAARAVEQRAGGAGRQGLRAKPHMARRMGCLHAMPCGMVCRAPAASVVAVAAVDSRNCAGWSPSPTARSRLHDALC